MTLLSDFAYGIYAGPLPMMAVVGFVTYGLFLLAAGFMISKRWFKGFARRAFRLHRWLAATALVLATLHLLMGLSAYV